MPKFKVTQEREKCLGCGACVSVCPANWEMDADGKAKPLETEVEEVGCNQAAADSCPVQCIHVEPLTEDAVAAV